MKRFLLICAIFISESFCQECKRYYVPKKFIFSTATSAFQIEGAAREDGKGPSGVDVYYHNVPNTVERNDTADVSCDSYHKYKEDVRLLKNLGVKQYRFSISWPRILPFGTLEKINRKGIEYYNNLINELIANGIEPLISMVVWDEPETLIEKGGWLNQDMPKYFGKYARLLFKTFGDRVKKWTTLNEPFAVVYAWYCGQIAYINCPWTLYRAGHNFLLGHAKVTILHWDEPEVLIQQGGWLNQEMPKHFGKYARFLYKNFGDRVKKWATLNEPFAVVYSWYCGQIAYINCQWTLYRSAHNFLLGHAEAYRIYEKEFRKRQKGQVGIVLSTGWFEPATNSSEDLAATNRSRDFELGWFAEPIFKGDYPETMRSRIAKRSFKDGYIKSRLPEFTTYEKTMLKASADFLGLNYYSSLTVKNRVDFHYGVEQTEYDGGFEADGLYNYPQGLRKLLVYASNEYHIPVLVTENGLGDKTGTLNDTDRLNYIKTHLIGVLQAIEEGANVIGYTVWSLMDNFEWGAGFTIKFGIHHVDFADPNRTRTPKESGKWYARVISNRYVDEC